MKEQHRGGRLFRGQPRAEIDDELTFHLEERIQEFIDAGMDPDAARAAALERLGDLREVREDCAQLLSEELRAETRREWFSDFTQDVRFGVRSALRAPLFSLVALVTLALGIGANAAVFGVVKSVLLDALPYHEPDRLVRVYGAFRDGSQTRGPLSAGTIADVADRQRSFEGVGASATGTWEATLTTADGAEVIDVLWLEPRLLRVLGVTPARGRLFADDDARDTAQVVLLTHAAWQARFGGANDILGRTVRLNDIPRTVIGVLPRGFVAPPGGDPEIYLPLNLELTLRNPISARGSHWLALFGRLRAGVAPEAAEGEMKAIAADLAREYPDDNANITMMAESLRAALVGNTRVPLLVLVASAVLVLLIACANLAAALLSRAITRRKEFAVRVSLGAGRGRLMRQLLTESLLLSVAGGAAGLLLAQLALGLMRGVAANALPDHARVGLDTGAIIAAFLLTVITGLLFGAVPALAGSRTDPQGTLRDESRGASAGRGTGTLRGVLVAAQVALCLTLLTGAGLLTRSLWALMTTPHGFDASSALTVTVPLPSSRYATAEAHVAFHEQLRERLRATPGIADVASVSELPTRIGSRNGTFIEGRPWADGETLPFILTAAVSESFFDALRIPVLQGRTFSTADRADSPPVVVITERMARLYWPEGNAVGARIRMGPDPNAPWMEIIGVVGDVRNDVTQRDAEPLVFHSHRQSAWGDTYIIRTRGNPIDAVNTVRREVAALDAALPIDNIETLDNVVGDGLAGRRLPVLLLSAFGLLALVLAGVGVYALFASMAAAREREFGVRMALGSSRTAIATLVLRQGALWMGIGLVAGAVGVFAVTRAVRSMLYGVQPLDPVALSIAVIALILCAAIAVLVPVRRATRVDPATVMH